MEQRIQHDPNFIGINTNGHLSIEPIEDLYLINADFDFLDHGLRRHAHASGLLFGAYVLHTYTKSQIQKLLGDYFSENLWYIDQKFNVRTLNRTREYVFIVLYMLNNIRNNPIEIPNNGYVQLTNSIKPRNFSHITYDGYEYDINGLRLTYPITRYFDTNNIYLLASIVGVLEHTIYMHEFTDNDTNEYIYMNNDYIIMDRREYFTACGVSQLVDYNIKTYDIEIDGRIYKSIFDDYILPSAKSCMINRCYLVQSVIKKEYDPVVLSQYYAIKKFHESLLDEPSR